VFVEAMLGACHEFVVAQFPDASPEAQAWLTIALFDFLFGDWVEQFLFGAGPGLGR
jgi:hypothetical protein